jgi:hypothetical protein
MAGSASIATEIEICGSGGTSGSLLDELMARTLRSLTRRSRDGRDWFGRRRLPARPEPPTFRTFAGKIGPSKLALLHAPIPRCFIAEMAASRN